MVCPDHVELLELVRWTYLAVGNVAFFLPQVHPCLSSSIDRQRVVSSEQVSFDGSLVGRFAGNVRPRHAGLILFILHYMKSLILDSNRHTRAPAIAMACICYVRNGGQGSHPIGDSQASTNEMSNRMAGDGVGSVWLAKQSYWYIYNGELGAKSACAILSLEGRIPSLWFVF